ncbi:MAG TPA: penicillin acylase family protein [Sphingomicrobium sp.]|nr:penicillin acylase family protein [Sphingomicrobium sp.]
MHRTAGALLFLLLTAASPPELARWKAESARVTITRDDWGIAHIHGKTDADAVFGMIYAQAEDDFPRIEANYLTNLGRTAEADGETAIWQDLRARLYVSDSELKANYARSPLPMRKLMDAWADGLNYFLATHPDVRPRAIKRFEPWMVLSFTEGSIGGDIERIDLDQLKAFYSGRPIAAALPPKIESQGSNGIAIAPKITSDGHALLLINPHTSHYFRSEAQVTSDEGLNVYGASTWGQFFVYQGFNAHAGWMHTSSGVDSVDEFAETIERKRGTNPCSRYRGQCRPLGVRPVTIRYRMADGRLGSRTFRTWRTHHGPIVRAANGRWIAFAMMDRPVEALQQSFGRTKAKDLESFLKIANLKANSSNDTIFADDKGEIAYLHPQFVPRRDNRFDYEKPVDGSNPATDWRGLHALSELPNVIRPASSWVVNTNDWPYSAAGADSPDPKRFPKYMDMVGPNFRGEHATQMLKGSSGWTLEKLQAAAYDNYQPGFAQLIPTLIRAYDALPTASPRRRQLGPAIESLRPWNYRWGVDSVPQTVATSWGNALVAILHPPAEEDGNLYMARLARDTTDAQKLEALDKAIGDLQRDFGRWQVPWGEVNRFQRISRSIKPQFSDQGPSIPVGFGDAHYGSLAALVMRSAKTTRRLYGTYGNSFVAVVEFGPRVRAHAITAGGESGDPKSPHFNDQAPRYASGNLREVYFYPEQLKGHTERHYHPGD